ncbi:hypothetical protein D3C84_1069910 [compost metagenome]
MYRLVGSNGVVAGTKFGKATADLDLVTAGFLPEVLVHFSMDQLGQLGTISIKDFMQLAFGIVLPLVMGHRLTCEII